MIACNCYLSFAFVSLLAHLLCSELQDHGPCQDASDFDAEAKLSFCGGDEQLSKESCLEHGCRFDEAAFSDPKAYDWCVCDNNERCAAVGGMWYDSTCAAPAAWTWLTSETSCDAHHDTYGWIGPVVRWWGSNCCGGKAVQCQAGARRTCQGTEEQCLHAHLPQHASIHS